MNARRLIESSNGVWKLDTGARLLPTLFAASVRVDAAHCRCASRGSHRGAMGRRRGCGGGRKERSRSITTSTPSVVAEQLRERVSRDKPGHRASR